MKQPIEQRLSGGHPNSLGQTVSVAADVLNDSTGKLFEELCATYDSHDEVVRLRVSSVLKRVCGLHRSSLPTHVQPKPEWILKQYDWLIDSIGWNLDQPSAKWAIAQMIQELQDKLSDAQRIKAVKLLKHNFETEDDWIVLNTTADALVDFAMNDAGLKKWLLPRLTKMRADKRKSVSAKADKLKIKLSG